MDIRNFFGKPKKKASTTVRSASSGTAPSPSPSSKSKSKKTGTASTTDDKNNNNKKASAALNDDGSDTEMEEDEVVVVTSATTPAKTTNTRGKKEESDSDTTTTLDDDPPTASTTNGRGRKKKDTSRMFDDSDSDTEMDEPASSASRSHSVKKSAHFNNNNNNNNVEDVIDGESTDKPSAPRGRSAKRARTASKSKPPPPPSTSSDSEEEPPAPPRRTSPRRKSPRRSSSSRASPAIENRKGRRRIEIRSESSDDDDDILEMRPAPKRKLVSVDLMDDSSDEDFKPEVARGDHDGDDDDNDNDNDNDDSDEDFTQPPKKRKSASTKRAASPRKRATPKKETPKKASPKRASAKKSPLPPQQQQPSSGPPKYHPPSSKLAAHIPFLQTSSAISLPSAPPLPKLPDDDPNFDIDLLVPRCLEGLTFVFTGILSTDAKSTAETSAAVSLASPTKGDYYANRRLDVASDSTTELSRDAATDIVKSLGGRVTSAVSGRTDYLIAGSVLEDGRAAEEGSKYKKCVGMWEGWRDKYREEYEGENDGDGDGNESKKRKGSSAKPRKDRDPNSLVEIVEGVYEFYGLVAFLSEWKRGTLSESEREELEARRKPREEVKIDPTKAASTPSTSRANPYVGSAIGATTSASRPAVSNPYASASKPSAAAVSNPYAKKSTTPTINPYAKKSSPANPYGNAPSNPYARKSPPAPPASKSPTASASSSSKSKNSSGKDAGPNSLWADRYAPSSSREILGNADSVNKLNRWLSNWENTFNDPRRKGKSVGNPNGPFKAALLSGPPGIGKTTTATLVANESGRDVLELNASDARGKKALGAALGDVTGSQVLSFDNNAGTGGSRGKKAPVRRRCIIMDEVDGMGAGDRSGISELIQMIKKSKVPIICICNDRSSQKIRSLVQYCMDLRYRRPTKGVIARRAVEIGRREGMDVEINAAEAMAESCGNDIRQVLNSLQMWSCKKRAGGAGGRANMTYRDLKDRQGEINKDEVLRVSMFDACRSIVEGPRGLAGADPKAATASFFKRTDAYFVDYMLMGLMVHQNYLKVATGRYNDAKVKGDEDDEEEALNAMHKATHAMSDFGMCENSLRGGDQNWSLLPLCSVLAVKVGHHAGGPDGGFLPGYPEFAGWLGKNSSRNKRVRLLQELRRHMNYKVSADAPELRMTYFPVIRQQFQQLLFDSGGTRVAEAIELMDEYGLDRDDVFENLDEFLFHSKELETKKFGDLDGKSKAAFTRAYNAVAHKAQALVAEQGAEKTGRKKGGGGGGEMGGAELDVVDDDKAAAEDTDEEEDEEDLEALRKKFLKKGRGKSKAAGKGKAAGKTNGKKGRKK